MTNLTYRGTPYNKEEKEATARIWWTKTSQPQKLTYRGKKYEIAEVEE